MGKKTWASLMFKTKQFLITLLTFTILVHFECISPRFELSMWGWFSWENIILTSEQWELGWIAACSDICTVHYLAKSVYLCFVQMNGDGKVKCLGDEQTKTNMTCHPGPPSFAFNYWCLTQEGGGTNLKLVPQPDDEHLSCRSVPEQMTGSFAEFRGGWVYCKG